MIFPQIDEGGLFTLDLMKKVFKVDLKAVNACDFNNNADFSQETQSVLQSVGSRGLWPHSKRNEIKKGHHIGFSKSCQRHRAMQGASAAFSAQLSRKRRFYPPQCRVNIS